MLLNNEGVGVFEFSPTLQNWPVPHGSLIVVNFSLLQNGVTYTLQNESIEAWNADGTVLINNSNC